MTVALVQFRESLDRVRLLADTLRHATSLDPEALALRETQQCGAIVLLSGYFEAFLKVAVKDCIDQICKSGLAFSALPVKMQIQHYAGGAEILKRIAASPQSRYPGVTREDLASRLGSVLSSSYQLVWEGFANTRSNPRPSVVAGIAKKFGFTGPTAFWDSVWREAGAPVQFAGSTIERKLDDLIDKRNECAHTGTVYPVPTPSDIIDYVDLLEVVGMGFVGVMQNQLIALGVTPPPEASPPEAPPPP
jgi:hypothetical protein